MVTKLTNAPLHPSFSTPSIWNKLTWLDGSPCGNMAWNSGHGGHDFNYKTWSYTWKMKPVFPNSQLWTPNQFTSTISHISPSRLRVWQKSFIFQATLDTSVGNFRPISPSLQIVSQFDSCKRKSLRLARFCSCWMEGALIFLSPNRGSDWFYPT